MVAPLVVGAIIVTLGGDIEMAVRWNAALSLRFLLEPALMPAGFHALAVMIQIAVAGLVIAGAPVVDGHGLYLEEIIATARGLPTMIEALPAAGHDLVDVAFAVSFVGLAHDHVGPTVAGHRYLASAQRVVSTAGITHDTFVPVRV
ncbi:hypothetical protein C0995_016388, partial [Termitomyces sp. Mi166